MSTYLPTYLSMYIFFALCFFFPSYIWLCRPRSHTQISDPVLLGERNSVPTKGPPGKGAESDPSHPPQIASWNALHPWKRKACATCPARYHSETLTSKGHFISPRLSPKALIKDMLQQQQKKGRKEKWDVKKQWLTVKSGEYVNTLVCLHKY